MRPSCPRRLTAVFLVVPVVAACAAAGGIRPAPEAGRPAGESAADLEALYRARMDSAAMNVSKADVDFMTGMIFHHAQALVMSAWAPGHGAGPSVRTLTSRIINAQKDEIATMQRWLRDRGQPVPEVAASGHMVLSPGADGMRMPGMLTPKQMSELEAAGGTDFDRLFLTYMIQHHQGAVTMVRDLFGTDGAAQDDLVFKIASDIQVDQITEISRMRRMLDALQASRSHR